LRYKTVSIKDRFDFPSLANRPRNSSVAAAEVPDFLEVVPDFLGSARLAATSSRLDTSSGKKADCKGCLTLDRATSS
jgi:hypothetical protein